MNSVLFVASHDVQLEGGGGGDIGEGGGAAAAAVVIKIDCDDLFLRLNVDHGFQDLFQNSVTYAALDRRPYSPPLETRNDRVVNMRNVCETFEVSNQQMSRLEEWGCKSIAHLALLGRDHLARIMNHSSRSSNSSSSCSSPPGCSVQRLEKVISILNHSPIEPLYSLKRYWYDREPKHNYNHYMRRASLVNPPKLLPTHPPEEEAKEDYSYLHLEKGATAQCPPLVSPHPFVEASSGRGGGPRILTLLTFSARDPTPFRAKRRNPAPSVAAPPRRSAALAPVPEKDLSVPPPKIHTIPATPVKISKRPLSTSSSTHSRHSPRTPSSKCGSGSCPTTTTFPAHRGCFDCGKETWPLESGGFHKYCSPCWRGHRGAYSSGNEYSCKSYGSNRSHHYYPNQNNNSSPSYSQGYSKQKVLTCKNIALGCSLILSGADMRKHEAHCDYNVLVCPWPECLYEGTSFQLQHHLEKSHERVFIEKSHERVFMNRRFDLPGPPTPGSGRYMNGGGGDGHMKQRCNYLPESTPEICIPVEIRRERLFPSPPPTPQHNFYSGQKSLKQQWTTDFHWEPIQFDFDNCKFFQFMRRHPESYGGGKARSSSLAYYFWLWTPSAPEIAQKYRYEVTLWNITEHNRQPPEFSRGIAQSLQHNAQVILSPNNRKNIACFHESKVNNNISSNGLMRFEVRVWKSSNYGGPDLGGGRRGSK